MKIVWDNIGWSDEFGVGNAPDGLTIYGGISPSGITSLPKNLTVTRMLILRYSNVKALPACLRVDYLLDLQDSSIIDIPASVKQHPPVIIDRVGVVLFNGSRHHD